MHLCIFSKLCRYVHHVMGVCCIVLDIDGMGGRVKKMVEGEGIKICYFQHLKKSFFWEILKSDFRGGGGTVSNAIISPDSRLGQWESILNISSIDLFWFLIPSGGGVHNIVFKENQYFHVFFAFYAIYNIFRNKIKNLGEWGVKKKNYEPVGGRSRTAFFCIWNFKYILPVLDLPVRVWFTENEGRGSEGTKRTGYHSNRWWWTQEWKWFVVYLSCVIWVCLKHHSLNGKRTNNHKQ